MLGRSADARPHPELSFITNRAGSSEMHPNQKHCILKADKTLLMQMWILHINSQKKYSYKNTCMFLHNVYFLNYKIHQVFQSH